MKIDLDYLHGYPDIKLYQDHDSFCMNTDTYLLGEYIKITSNQTVLDIGTNNGSLLLYASRFKPSKMIGIDVNKDALELAKTNLEMNNISNFELYKVDARDYKGERVDVIISNPPYFKGCEEGNKDSFYTSKHEDSLPLEELIKCINYNLKENGNLYLIFQSFRLVELIKELDKFNIKIKELVPVYNSKKENSNVVLIKAVKNGNYGVEIKKPIIIE